MKKYFFGASAWIFENPARPVLLSVLALVVVAGLTQRAHFKTAVAQAQTMACPQAVSMPSPALPALGPPPRPKWIVPTRQVAMLDPRDGCAPLAGLGHGIGKCWSHDLYDDPRGVSRWLYHADWVMICKTKRKAGLPCPK